jgi:hypothetical protein
MHDHDGVMMASDLDAACNLFAALQLAKSCERRFITQQCV